MADNTQTFFGNINSIIAQSANSAAAIAGAVIDIRGKSPDPRLLAQQAALKNPPYTTSQVVGVGLLIAVLGTIVFLIIREGR